MHELGSLCVGQDGEIYTKVNRNLRSYRVYNMVLLIPMPDMFPVVYYMGNSSEKKSRSYVEELLMKENCKEVLEVHQNILKDRGLSVDEICSLLNFLINSPSLLGIPNIMKMSDKVMQETARKLMTEGW